MRRHPEIMKRCPQCLRDYYDDSLSYCFDDGAPLLEGSEAEPPTAIIADGRSSPSLPGSRSDPSSVPARSIAVLPFSHLSSDPDDEHFCDGLTEELLNALARVEDLKVAARTSSF